MFPGQGSQRVGMGAGLFESFPTLVACADEVLGYSIKELCLDDPDSRLGRTEYTQPALYVVTVLEYLSVADVSSGMTDAAYLLGHSLGEYVALFAAGVVDFVSGLRLVKERGRLMARASRGGMAAVIGFNGEQVQAVIERAELTNVSIANYNSPTQIVVSGDREAIGSAGQVFLAAGARRYVNLQVSGAFHSPFMESAAKEYQAAVSEMMFGRPKTPIVANVTARPYQPGSIAETLVKQLVQPVRWEESIRYLADLGVTEFHEIGPGRVLTGLTRQIL